MKYKEFELIGSSFKCDKNCPYCTAKITKWPVVDDKFELFPQTPSDYNNLYQSYIGGFCICNYPKLDVRNYNTIEVDRKSAYIYDLLIEKHICEPLHKENKEYFQYYFENSEDYYIQAVLRIRFSGAKKGYEIFKDMYGNNLEPNKDSYIRINNIDLNLIIYQINQFYV